MKTTEAVVLLVTLNRNNVWHRVFEKYEYAPFAEATLIKEKYMTYVRKPGICFHI